MTKMLPLLAAALLFSGAAAAAPSGSVEVHNAWARATPGGAKTGAAYMTLESPAGDRLTVGSSPVARKAEMHEMTMSGTIMRMRQLPSIPLPPGQKITLQPGRMHIMLLGLKKPLRPGESFPLTLDFAKAGQREITVPIEKIGAMGPINVRQGNVQQGNVQQGGGMAMPMPH
jgi:hypothetical protein